MPSHDLPRRAKWIHLDDGDDASNSYFLFRGTFRITTEPRQARLLISADTRYRLYVNGHYVADGPPPSMASMTYFDAHEIASLLERDENVIAVILRHVGDRPHSRPGLIAELTTEEDIGIATDQTWRGLRPDAWRRDTHYFRMNRFDGYQEHFDARKEPAGWREPGFDDNAWPRVRVIEDGPWHLRPRSIPSMIEQPRLPTEVTCVEECTWLNNRMRSEDLSISLSQAGVPMDFALVENAAALCVDNMVTTVACSTEHLHDHTFDGVREPCLTLDLGRIHNAYIEIDVEGAAGSLIEIGTMERLIDGRFNNAIEGMQSVSYRLREGRQTWRSFTWRGMRYIRLRFRACYEPLKIHAVRAIETRYPFESRGWIKSTPRVESIFAISRHTLNLCSQESLMDTPWREQAQWLGDVAAVTLGGLYACFGDHRLAGKFLRQSAATQRPDGLLANITNIASDPRQARDIPDYSLWWTQAVWDHYQYTGERVWIDELYPVATRILDAHLKHVDGRGLVRDMPGWIFIDWANVDKRGAISPLNALVAGTLDVMVKMAAMVGDAEGEARWGNAAGAIRAAFSEVFFDRATGVFIDCEESGKRSTSISEQANAAAILFDCCDVSRANAIISVLWGEGPTASDIDHVVEAQPFFTWIVLKALVKRGRFDRAMRMVEDRWGGRMLDRGATSCFEEWGINGSWRNGDYMGFIRTQSHAWSACPAEFLLRVLPGITIVEPGCGKLRIQPHTTDFDWTVVFPTPCGDVKVWQLLGEHGWELPEGIERAK